MGEGPRAPHLTEQQLQRAPSLRVRRETAAGDGPRPDQSAFGMFSGAQGDDRCRSWSPFSAPRKSGPALMLQSSPYWSAPQSTQSPPALPKRSQHCGTSGGRAGGVRAEVG